MPEKRPPKDANELAKYILDVTTGDAEKIKRPKKNPHSGTLKLGASKGGKARAKLTAKKRSQIARQTAKSRWTKK